MKVVLLDESGFFLDESCKHPMIAFCREASSAWLPARGFRRAASDAMLSARGFRHLGARLPARGTRDRERQFAAPAPCA